MSVMWGYKEQGMEFYDILRGNFLPAKKASSAF